MTFSAGPDTAAADRERFLGSSPAVVAIESDWVAKVQVIDDPVVAILQRDVELRALQELWTLRDAVTESTLEFSIIRWRNAAPRRGA